MRSNVNVICQFSTLMIAILILSAPPASYASENNAPSPAASMAEFCHKLPRPEYKNLTRVEDPDSWFELYRVAPGVTAIYEPFQWQEVISYLIEGEQSALLFDTGNGIGDIRAVVKRLTNKPLVVINSHGHYDHVGGNHAFENVWGMNTEFSKTRSHGMPNSAVAEEVSAAALCRPLPQGISERTHTGRPYKFSKLIKDGQKIELGNRRLEVLHIPGHTPDAIALLERETGLLWTGDTLYAGPIWLYAPETDLTAYQNSLRRLMSEMPNITALLLAHNTPWLQPSILQQVQSAFERLLKGELPMLASQQGTVTYGPSENAVFSFLLRADQIQSTHQID